MSTQHGSCSGTISKLRSSRGRALRSVLAAALALLVPSVSAAFYVEPEARALEALRGRSAVPVDVRFESGFPRSLRLEVTGPEAGTPAQAAAAFIAEQRDLFSQDHTDLALVPVASELAEADVVSFQQSFRGIPVFGAQIAVVVQPVVGTAGGLWRIVHSAGWLLPATPQLDPIVTVPAITAGAAVSAARAAAGWSSAPVLGETALVIFSRAALGESDPRGPVLAWRVSLAGPAPQQVLIDAHTGEVAYQHALAADGAGLSDYDADFEDANGGTMASTNCFNPTTIDDDIGSEDGLIASYLNDPEAAATWWNVRDTYSAFHDLLGRHSWDNDDEEIRAYIHIGLDGNGNPNATYNDGCQEIEFHDRFVGLDVVAHEFTHAIIRHSLSDLVYQGQSGALNEAFADSLAALVVDTNDWLIGEGLLNGQGPIRSLADPQNGQCDSPMGAVGFSNCGDPDRWSQRLSFTTSTDSGNVHSNSGIQNKATFLMSQGGFFNGHSISGMGRAKTRRLVYFMTRFLLPSTATFADARNFAVVIAQNWAQSATHGFTASDLCTVRNAYAAVELGNPDQDCDGSEEAADADGDGVLDVLDNCLGLSNPSQTDADTDGIGDACDTDGDNDGIPDGIDLCPGMPNTYLGNLDPDGDGMGNACDPDDDDDGVPDDGAPGDVPCLSFQTTDCDDNCREDPNPDQFDGNSNGYGDACDPDHDGDGWYVDQDNCVFVHNVDQADADGDGIGDACDKCPEDYDTIQAYTTGTLFSDPEPYQPDSDGDGIPDLCDDLYMATVGLTSGGVNWNEGLEPRPDGTRHLFEMVGPAYAEARIPLGICDPLGDPDGYAAGEYVELVFQELSDHVAAAVVDDSGRIHERLSPTLPGTGAGVRGLRFRPRCDRRWFLRFELGPEFPGAASFTLVAGVVEGGSGIENPWRSHAERALPPPERPADADRDGVPDTADVCPAVFDPGQENGDGDTYGDACDLCPAWPSSGRDTDGNGIGDECECGDQNEDGFVNVADILAIGEVIFELVPESLLCDANDDGMCNVADILAVNAKIFGAPAHCARYPSR